MYRLITLGGYLGSGRSLDSCRGRGGEKLANTLGELGSVTGPIFNAVALQVDGCGIGAGVVGADDFHGTAVACTVLFDNNDAIVGLLSCANARQTDHQHRKTSRKNKMIWDKKFTGRRQ